MFNLWKWEISHTKPVNPLTVGNRGFWRLLSRVSGLNLGPHGSEQQNMRFQKLTFWIYVLTVRREHNL